MTKSRWERTDEIDLGFGLWKFEFRDKSYDPGDWCVLYSTYVQEGLRPGEENRCLAVCWYYDLQNRYHWPPEFAPYVAILMERFEEFHKSPLERLAAAAD